jgi:GxxExxY protein
MVCWHLQRNICAPSGAGTVGREGFLRRISGISRDVGDARLLGPAPQRIISCAFRVANSPGHGFVEKVYEKALAHEMRKFGFGAVQQRGTVVPCDGVIVSEYTPGLLVEDQVIAELKVVAPLSDVHLPQRLAGDGPVAVPADQFRPAQSRNPPGPPSFACPVPSLACSLAH